MLFWKSSPCTAVIQYNSTSYSSVFLSRSMVSCIRIPARRAPCSRSECASFRAGNTALNARPIDYHIRLIAGPVGLSAMCHLKNDFPDTV